MNTYSSMNTIAPGPKKPSMACMKAIKGTSNRFTGATSATSAEDTSRAVNTTWLDASHRTQDALDLHLKSSFTQRAVFARIGKQIAACAAWSQTDAAKEAEELPVHMQHITSTFTCRVLEGGGWEIPKGSVIPAFTQVPPLSVIGTDCVFGHHCTLLDHCTVGSDCVFGEACSFIGLPVFGDRCVFAGHCEFTAGAKFGHACVFGPVPRFNFDTEFGNYCSFPVGTDWGEFGLKFGAECVGAPVSSVEESKGVAHAH